MEKIGVRNFTALPVISPSILAADFARLGDEVQAASTAGADWMHLDVMDGHFVPNISFGPVVIRSLRKRFPQLVFDTHLMIEEPLRYASAFARAGSDHLTFHVETQPDPRPVIDAIHDLDCSAGLSLKPGTPAEVVFPHLDKVELILVMTVEPGFGGQSFMADMVDKIRALRREIDRRKLDVRLEVDGGIDLRTIPAAHAAGADSFVAGTAVFGAPCGIAEAVCGLKKACC